MNNLGQAIWVELLKARRSRLPLFTALGFSLLPVAGGFFMIVLKEPELARRMGLISAKAQLMAGSADWPSYLGVLAQGIAVAGLILYAFIAAWLFGREYADRTVTDLLALPTARSAVVLAKFAVFGLWAAVVTAWVVLLGLVVGAAVGLPAAAPGVVAQGLVTVAICGGLTIVLSTPIAYFASAGHGYLAPLAVAVLSIFLAQVVAATGWGDFFPWSVPALRSGAAGPEMAAVAPVGYLLVLGTSLLGIVATVAWWERADQVW